LFDCDDARTSCDRIVRDTVTLAGADGVFAPVAFDLTLGTDPYVVDPGRRLELRYATLNASVNDSWIAYDTDSAPARLVITPPAAPSGGVGMGPGPRPAWPVPPITLLLLAVAAVVATRCRVGEGRDAPRSAGAFAAATER
jgi:hypothetical protein